jgi:hypothetical protein
MGREEALDGAVEAAPHPVRIRHREDTLEEIAAGADNIDNGRMDLKSQSVLNHLGRTAGGGGWI